MLERDGVCWKGTEGDVKGRRVPERDRGRRRGTPGVESDVEGRRVPERDGGCRRRWKDAGEGLRVPTKDRESWRGTRDAGNRRRLLEMGGG